MTANGRTLLLFVLSLCCASAAQVAPGFPSFVPQDCHEVDCVDLLNNNVSLSVPIRSKAGAMPLNVRGAASYYMSVGSGEWSPAAVSATALAAAANGFLQPFINTGAYPTISTPGTPCTGGGTTTKWTGWVVQAANYTIHPLPSTLYTDVNGSGVSCIAGSGFTSQETTDGSGLSVSAAANGVAASSIYDRSGTSLTAAQITDSNGNKIYTSSGALYDSMGLPALFAGFNSVVGPFEWTDVNGGTAYVSFNAPASTTVQTNFGCTGIYEYGPMTAAYILPTSVTFADSRVLSLSYEPTPSHSSNITGRLQKITLPEGGTVTYAYTGTHGGIDCTYQNAPTITRTLGNGDTTTYTLTHNLISGSNYNAINTVVDPGGNKTAYTFTGFTSTGVSPTYAQVLTRVLRYLGASTFVSQDLYSYNTAFTSTPSPSTIAGAQVTLPVTSLIVYHQLSGMSNWAATETHYDTYGNVTYSAQYDFGGTSPTRATTITYGTWNGSTCVAIGNNINDRPCEVTTTQSGTTVAQSLSIYDSHGNLSRRSYMANGSYWIGQVTPNSYNPNGTPLKTYDLGNNETDYTYSTSGSGYSQCSGCTQYPFPIQIKNAGTGNYVNYTWYGEGGVVATATDRNSAKTTYGYTSPGGTADPYWRVMSVTDPLNNVVTTTYPSGSNPTYSNSLFYFNSGNSIQGAEYNTDGYGRPIDAQVYQSPTATTLDTVSTSYSWWTPYRYVQTSQPCSTTSGQLCPFVHGQYFDPLGRLYQETTANNEDIINNYNQNDVLTQLTPAPSGENIKQVQKEYDGLGRLSKSCQILSSGGSACGQNTGTLSGITDTYSYTAANGDTAVAITRGSQTRTFVYDALGRMVEKITPEGGTWWYQYDVDSSCPSGYGDIGQLAAISDPNGNFFCFAYDSQNRVTTVNASNTFCRHFYYDNSGGYSGTLPSGISLSNQYGRMVEAATDSCASGTLITDEWFGYDADGRNTKLWESTPHSTLYYGSIATFFGNGKVNTLQIGSPSLYTITYGLDGEGRWNTMTDSTHSKTLVSATSFYPVANPSKISLGSGNDNDQYTYDANTGNITQYQFTVGSSSMTGALTWNANRTLAKLAITDGFNSGGTQTCNYNPNAATGTGYDDLGRLVGVDCGSGQWGQTYSYDSAGLGYDNLVKSVISGRIGTMWSPGYSSTTNHCNSPCTYDSNGNVTSDGNYNYGWNAFSKLAWDSASGTPTCGSSGRCITYDAFGRIVETSNGSTWTEYLLTPVGAVANMSATTINYATWPAPAGGSVIVYGGGGGNYGYLHKDWLGNARVTSSITANTVVYDVAYSPYGEMYDSFGTLVSQYTEFAGITGNFHNGVAWDTPNRELSYVGRWLSPDPAGRGWNQYAYATNPNSFVDPTGLYVDGPNHGCVQAAGDPCVGPPDGGGGGGGCLDAICGNNGVDSSSECPICTVPNVGGFGADAGFLAFQMGYASALQDIPIFDFHSDEFGYMVGDFAGEIYCPAGVGFCDVWNPNAGLWQLLGEADVYPPLAQQAIGGHLQLWQSASTMIGIASSPYAVAAGSACAATQACVATGLATSLLSFDIIGSFSTPEFENQPATMPLDVGHAGEPPGYEGPGSQPAPINGGSPPPAPPLPPAP